MLDDPLPAAFQFPTVAHALSYWAGRQPDSPAFTHLKGKQGESELSYAALYSEATYLALHLESRGLSGERVLLAMNTGLDYVVGFFACLMAGCVAVPLYPPSTERDRAKLRGILADCSPKGLLVESESRGAQADELGRLIADAGCTRFVTSELRCQASSDPAGAPEFQPRPDTLAFLQYTSGSTGHPRGVMVTHANILHNEALIAAAMGHDRASVFVSWLPFHHDMGMVGIVMNAVSVGGHGVVMAPTRFVRQPFSWLEAISRFRGTTSGGPNFAYERCVSKISDAEIKKLDLSCWAVAFNGAEPVRASTLERFYERFRHAGLRREALFPCYGLAEATLYVAGGPFSSDQAKLSVPRASLGEGQPVVGSVDSTTQPSAAHGRLVELVSLGRRRHGQQIRIVDPDTWHTEPDGRVGEVWVKGPSVARGYWNKPEESAKTFHGYTLDTNEGPFLRTGDLGFLASGRLVITGRLKELVIINGVNHYPHDIEATVERLSEDFRRHCGAAFNTEEGGLAIVQGLDKRTEIDAASHISSIQRAVLKVHGIAVSYVALVLSGHVPKTSSGKIQRREVQRRYAAGELRPLAEATAPSDAVGSTFVAGQVERAASLAGDASPTLPRVEQKLQWLQGYLSSRVNSLVIDERRTIPPYVVLDFGNQGLLGMQAPETDGGLGFSNRDFLRVVEALGARDLTLALFVGLNNVLGLRPVLKFGTPELKQRYLGALASGRELAAFALTEPGAGSNPHALETVARQGGDGCYHLFGQKIWSGSAAWAGLLNVFAKARDRSGRITGINGFAIPQASIGLRQGPEALTMGVRGMVQNAVTLEGVVAEPWQLLGNEARGMEVAQDALRFGRITIAAAAVGAMKLCYQTMLGYADERQISTGLLLDNPQSRTVLADTMHAIEAVGHLVLDIAEALDEGDQIPGEVLAAAKSISTEWLWKAVDATMQLLGGRGYIESNVIPQLFRDARVFRIFEGPTETLHHYVGMSAQRSPQSLRAYLARRLDAGELTRMFDSVTQEFASPSSSREAAHAHASALGAYLDHLIVYGLARGRSSRATEEWLLSALEAARLQLPIAARRLSAAPAAASLREFGRRIDGQYAPWSQDRVYPNTELDDRLGALQKASATRAPEVAELAPPTAEARRASSLPVQEAKVPPLDARTGIRTFLRCWIAERCKCEPEAVDVHTEFAALGLGSIDASELCAALTDELGVDVDATALWNYPDVEALTGFLYELLGHPGDPNPIGMN